MSRLSAETWDSVPSSHNEVLYADSMIRMTILLPVALRTPGQNMSPLIMQFVVSILSDDDFSDPGFDIAVLSVSGPHR